MMGYMQDAEKTAESFDEDGWFKTGDIAARDNEGYVKREMFYTNAHKFAV